MKLIPAIDLKDNKVVLASGGKRHEYKELPSYLSPSSDPIKFIEFLTSSYDFNTIYLADLDSIAKYNGKNKLIDTILTKFKNINFIIDNGVRKFNQLNRFKSTNYVQIIATETYCDFRSLQLYSYKNFILSLDYKDNSIISQNEDYKILSPKKVICMSLDNVGKNIGPNKKNLESTKNIYPSSDIVVSGGIRHNDDILSIKNMGFKEILLLTAILKKNIKFDKL